ncbi:MAG: FCSD flavin-binding domain-containing protein [Sulfuritalea sp.]|nr:FCSD flavin-binding domain-containing protein [Sulfuritalea sp.]
MNRWTRRSFLGALGAGALLSGAPMVARGAAKGRVVIVGGGFGGAIAARYVGMADPAIEVTIIERSPQYFTCPFSNKVVAGIMELDALRYDLKAHAARGVRVAYDDVVAIDPAKRSVATAGGKQFAYDRLILAPGVELDYAAVEGATAGVETVMPHAWKAGEQTLLLRKQIEAMKDGGVFIITVPRRPYRCPPGPYERAALAAHYFKRHKPKSKVIILDDDNTMPKQSLFLESWNKLYPGMIDWVTGNNGGKMERVDIKRRMVITTDADFPADVISFVPPQKAGAIAQKTGLTDVSGWCPVDPVTLESTRHKNIHIVGDAAFTDGVPKSAHIAGAMGRTAARAVVALLQGKTPPSPQYVNTCYTLAAPDYGFSIAGIYEPKGGVIAMVPNSVTVSPTGAPEYMRRTEAEFAYGWLRNIAAEAFL